MFPFPWPAVKPVPPELLPRTTWKMERASDATALALLAAASDKKIRKLEKRCKKLKRRLKKLKKK